jgi:hypothetical protein
MPSTGSGNENLESEPISSITDEDKYYSQSTAEAQLQAANKARTQLLEPTYQKFLRSWSIRPSDVRILPEYL